MTELVFIVEEAPEGGYTAHAVGQDIFTEGDTREELVARVRDAVLCHFDRKEEAPKFVRLHYVKDELVPL